MEHQLAIFVATRSVPEKYMITLSIFLLIVFLIILNGFFVTAEFSLLRIPKTRIPAIVKDNSLGSKQLGDIFNNLNIYITSLQIGITLSTLSLGIVGEPFFRAIVENIIIGLSINISDTQLRYVSIIFGLILLLSVHSIFGEIAPKTVSIQKIDRTARLLAVPTYWFGQIIKPITNLYRYTAYVILRLARVEIETEIYKEVYSEDELKMIIHTSTKEGKIDPLEETMINKIFDFGDRTVKEILTPRYKIVAFPTDAKKNDLIDKARESGYSRFPVYEEEIDNLKGFIHIKDVILSIYEDPDFRADKIIRRAITIHEGMRLDTLLKKMQQKHSQLAIVVDEYGAIEGLVTIEDVLEEIVGPIEDEFDESETALVEFVTDETYKVDANITLEDFNEIIGAELVADDSITLAGYILENLESIPEEGSRIVGYNCEFIVIEMDGNRISKLLVNKVTNGDNGEPLVPIASHENLEEYQNNNEVNELKVEKDKS